MKEKIIIFIAFVATSIAFIEIKKKMDHYHEVEKFDQIKYILMKGNQGKITKL
jgi:hypothetical protein